MPFLPANQTQGRGEPELISPQTWGLSPEDATCQDDVHVFGDHVANLPIPQKYYGPPCALWWMPPLPPASQWTRIPVAGGEASGLLGSGEGWASG